MWFNAVYYLFVFINLFNIFGQEHLHTVLFYFLLVITKVTIALFSLASSEVIHDLIIRISHKVRRSLEDKFSCILRYNFLSRNFKLLLHKKTKLKLFRLMKTNFIHSI